MNAIPRVLAGTAVVLAAVLTTAPLTAGIADFVLNPGGSPDKRPGAQAVAGEHDDEDAGTTDAPVADAAFALRRTEAARSTALRTTGKGPRTTEPLEGRTLIPAREATRATPSAVTAEAHEVVSAEARIAALAADLRAGVEAGEMSEEDAARVLDDLAGYIRGERTWPERDIA
ncbi:hypothetical protein DFO66_101225 [Brevibacterium sanguinis]|uniref:Uncharacterized protein n=2 Tax=Brevibacterium TaxID=1696 RepID=A0A366IPY8_9MICO|nr:MULTISPECIES: hypothetical protein [Brevibacterium]RBP68001.1 hypothetical protein DFO66_101225 [Brevibacterium sanguinis]RBP74582.1 hypothetical protein DFO65_101304 [Brevibacterium celere]